MEDWQKNLLKVISSLEEKIDDQRFKLKKKMGWMDPLSIQPYRGFGNSRQLYMRGRVLEQEGLDLPSEEASVWQNIHHMYNRYESDEIPKAVVSYELSGLKKQIRCNDEGFFEIDLQGNSIPPLSPEKWQKVKLRLQDNGNEEQEKAEVEGEILMQQPKNSFGLISDIDDTILVSKATEFLDKIRLLLLKNAYTRKPFEGVAAFYRALESGKNKCGNPVFYLSSSSWNLYDLFDRFCDINGIPKGVFLLRELGITENTFIRSGHGSHKLDKIDRVLNTFTDLPFVLVGDSGQKDPEIYQEVVKRYPNRIKVIYIRDVHPEVSDKREKEVQKIVEEVEKSGVEMKLVQNSLEAAKHAVELGLILPEVLEEIEKEMEEDKKRPSDISHVLGLDKLLQVFSPAP